MSENNKYMCRYYQNGDKCTKKGFCYFSQTCSDYAEQVQIFTGSKIIRMEDIKLEHSFINSKPSESKCRQIKEYYAEHKCLDRPIYVECKGSGYVLKDNYARYYVAKQLGLKTVLARYGDRKKAKLELVLTQPGTKVRYVKDGRICKVIGGDYSKFSIEFPSGKIVVYGMDVSINNYK